MNNPIVDSTNKRGHPKARAMSGKKKPEAAKWLQANDGGDYLWGADAPDTLPELEREIGIADWLDPQTGEPAEGQSPPHLESE